MSGILLHFQQINVVQPGTPSLRASRFIPDHGKDRSTEMDKLVSFRRDSNMSISPSGRSTSSNRGGLSCYYRDSRRPLHQHKLSEPSLLARERARQTLTWTHVVPSTNISLRSLVHPQAGTRPENGLDRVCAPLRDVSQGSCSCTPKSDFTMNNALQKNILTRFFPPDSQNRIR
ncbi:MAG: hypothetical protein A4E65_00691 [Syntrophorhabdus sp. PtaU1.Bin153]|nr:MAG: hypothetical protein A4E65_00691 [Syntrophorhabdus sp. PtaU1.Bin153]